MAALDLSGILSAFLGGGDEPRPPKAPPGSESYMIEDSLFAPDDKAKLEYRGQNPFRIYGMLPKIMQVQYHGRGKNIFEDKFKWDISGDPRDFYFIIRLDDIKFDRFTSYQVQIMGLGKQPTNPQDPNGIIYLEIKGKVVTEYKFKSALEEYVAMSFVWLYHRLIYSSVRRRYIQILKEQTFRLIESIRRELGLPTDNVLELAGAASRVE